jgi:hypothetical protein
VEVLTVNQQQYEDVVRRVRNGDGKDLDDLRTLVKDLIEHVSTLDGKIVLLQADIAAERAARKTLLEMMGDLRLEVRRGN